MAPRRSPGVAESPGCQPLSEMYHWAVGAKPTRWAQVEERFLAAMWDADQLRAEGSTSGSVRQSGERAVFTDLIAQILESCSKKELHRRVAAPGLIFPKHNLDISYLEQGIVQIQIQTQVSRAPRPIHAARHQSPRDRQGSSGLDRWIKSAGLRTIDLKAQRARSVGGQGDPARDLVTWFHGNRPLAYLFLAIRVVDRNDLDRTIALADAAHQMMDGVGLLTFEPGSNTQGHCVSTVPPNLELDRVLGRVCAALSNLP